MKPKSILDPAFKYTNSASTDLAKTFARIRREQKAEAEADAASAAEQAAKVAQIRDNRRRA